MDKDKIVSYDNMSGHSKPNIKSMGIAKKAFDRLPNYLFKGGKKAMKTIDSNVCKELFAHDFSKTSHEEFMKLDGLADRICLITMG